MSESTAQKPETGLRVGITRAEYVAIEAANYSTLKHYRRTPLHAKEVIDHPPEPTDFQAFGTLVHCLALEPAELQTRYVVSPKFDRRTKEGKAKSAEFEAANVGKITVDPEDWDACLRMQEMIAASSVATELLTGPGKNEVGAVWNDPGTGLLCKGLIDRIAVFQGRTIVIDVKTTQDAGPESFRRDIYRYGYHLQAAFYLDGLNALVPANRSFVYIAIESKPPYAVALYELDADSIEVGRNEIRECLKEHDACSKLGQWPGYANTIQPLTLPRWAFNREEHYVAE